MHQHRPISWVAIAVSVVAAVAGREKVCSQPMFCATVKVVPLQVHSGIEWGKLEICSVMATSTCSFSKSNHDQCLPTVLQRSGVGGWVRAMWVGRGRAWLMG